MSRTLNIVAPIALLLSALALSACATKPEATPATTPAPVEAVVPVDPPVTTPTAIVEQPPVDAKPVPTQKIQKARKKMVAKPAPPKAPVVEPAPVAAPVAPVVAPPEPAPVTPPPAKETAEPGILERYWMWFLGLIIVIVGIIAWLWKSRE